MQPRSVIYLVLVLSIVSSAGTTHAAEAMADAVPAMAMTGAAPDAQSAPLISRFLSNGDQGFANFVDFETLHSLSVTVVRSGQGQTGAGTGQNETTYLTYAACANFQAYECEWGSGFIPNTDLQGSSAGGRLTLKTNTSEAINPSFLRVNGAGGAIDLTWSKNGYSSGRSEGVTEGRFVMTSFGVQPSLVRTLRSNGISTGDSASLSGYLLALVAGSNNGPFDAWLSSNRNLYMEMQICRGC